MPSHRDYVKWAEFARPLIDYVNMAENTPEEVRRRRTYLVAVWAHSLGTDPARALDEASTSMWTPCPSAEACKRARLCMLVIGRASRIMSARNALRHARADQITRRAIRQSS